VCGPAFAGYVSVTKTRPLLTTCYSIERSNDCCTSASNKSPFVCFASGDGLDEGCIDPVPILTRKLEVARCISQADCSPDSACVLPARTAQLMRLRVLPLDSEEGDESVVLWSGPPIEVHQEGRIRRAA